MKQTWRRSKGATFLRQQMVHAQEFRMFSKRGNKNNITKTFNISHWDRILPISVRKTFKYNTTSICNPPYLLKGPRFLSRSQPSRNITSQLLQSTHDMGTRLNASVSSKLVNYRHYLFARFLNSGMIYYSQEATPHRWSSCRTDNGPSPGRDSHDRPRPWGGPSRFPERQRNPRISNSLKGRDRLNARGEDRKMLRGPWGHPTLRTLDGPLSFPKSYYVTYNDQLFSRLWFSLILLRLAKCRMGQSTNRTLDGPPPPPRSGYKPKIHC